MSTKSTLPARQRRAALESLSRDSLAALTQHYELFVSDRRVTKHHIDALVQARGVDFAELLGRLKRDELKAMCQALGLDDTGREKQVIIDRILGIQPTAAPEQPTPAPEQQPTAAPQPAPPRQQRARRARARDADQRPHQNGSHDSNQRDSQNGSQETRASLGFENKLWDAADLLRNNMDPAEYKHVVLGLIFLKYISDAFEERRHELIRQVTDPASDEYIADAMERQAELDDRLEDRDEYMAENVFWVPAAARWKAIQGHATQADIGKRLDDAMDAIERDNRTLAGALPKIYALPSLDRHILGQLIDLVSGIGLGTREHRAKDTLGRVYEYFLSKFASAEGKGGGEFYTPPSVVRVLVELLEPYRGRVYDPCCGSGGMFVQSLKFIEAHDGRRDAVTIYGQESNPTTWRMARMNLAIRGIEANLGRKHADTFKEDLHPDLRADFILANPPFNVSAWPRSEDDVRWQFGIPPAGNANFAWVQHFVHHLAPNGAAGFVLANGSMSSMQGGEGDIRRALVAANLVDCIVALPGQLFYSTQIPACLWFLRKGRRATEVLFMDARKLGRMDTRVHRVFDDADIARVAATYHAWRTGDAPYQDVPGFCKAASQDDIAAHEHVLTPGRYVGAELAEEDEEDFHVRFQRLENALLAQFEQSRLLEAQIHEALKRIEL